MNAPHSQPSSPATAPAREPSGNRFCLHSANHKPCLSRALSRAAAYVMRFKILVSAVPLLVAAVFARGPLLAGARPCIAVGETSVQIASLPWHAQFHFNFTIDASTATVPVQIPPNADS